MTKIVRKMAKIAKSKPKPCYCLFLTMNRALETMEWLTHERMKLTTTAMV